MAEPISLTIGGRSHWGVALFDDEAAGERDDVQISNDALLTFSGSTVLDSGVEVSIRIEIEGEASSDNGDAKFAELSGSFGAIRVGNDDVAGKKMATLAPYATYFYGLNDAYWSFSYSSAFEGATSGQTWMDTYANAGVGASANLTYFSPVINGFSLVLPMCRKPVPKHSRPLLVSARGMMRSLSACATTARSAIPASLLLLDTRTTTGLKLPQLSGVPVWSFP